MANTFSFDPDSNDGSISSTVGNKSKPTFILAADGGAAKYRVFLDGVDLGDMTGDNFSPPTLKITAPTPLADGPHVIEAIELTPNPTKAVTPFSFVIDTAPPSKPTGLMLAPWADTGTKGDNITGTGFY